MSEEAGFRKKNLDSDTIDVRVEMDLDISPIQGGKVLKPKHTARIVFAVLMTLAIGAQADTIWDESVDGLLSSSAASPTVVTLVSPSDLVIGNGSLGEKFFMFTVPAGESVSSMFLDPGMGGILAADIISASINCGTYNVIAPVELLDGSNCAPSLPPGVYTVRVEVFGSQPWNMTITSTVPVELQSFTID